MFGHDAISEAYIMSDEHAQKIKESEEKHERSIHPQLGDAKRLH